MRTETQVRTRPRVEIIRSAQPSPWLAWALAALVVASVLASSLAAQLFGTDIQPISQVRIPIALEPAGWAFAIWGPIFAGLLAFGVYQLKHPADPRLATARWPMLLSMACGALWPLAVSRSDFVAALGLIVGMLVGVALAYGPTHPLQRARSFGERVCVRWPLSAYIRRRG